MKKIKKVLVIDTNSTLDEYLSNIDKVTQEKQDMYPDYLVKVYSFVTKDNKVIISSTPDNYKFMGVEAGLYEIMDIDSLNLFTLDQEMLNIYEIAVVKNSLIPTYQEVVDYAQHKADELFDNDPTRIPIVYIIDYKFGNKPVAISASIFGEIDAKGNTTPLINPSAPVQIVGGNSANGANIKDGLVSIKKVEKLSKQFIAMVGLDLSDKANPNNVTKVYPGNVVVPTDKGDLYMSPYIKGGIVLNDDIDKAVNQQHISFSATVMLPTLSDGSVAKGGVVQHAGKATLTVDGKKVPIVTGLDLFNVSHNENEEISFSDYHTHVKVPKDTWVNVAVSIKDWKKVKKGSSTYYYRICDIWLNGEYITEFQWTARSKTKDYFADVVMLGDVYANNPKDEGAGVDRLMYSFKGLIKDIVSYDIPLDNDKAKEIYKSSLLTNGKPNTKGLFYTDIKYSASGDIDKGVLVAMFGGAGSKVKEFTRFDSNILNFEDLYDNKLFVGVNNELLQEALSNMKHGIVVTDNMHHAFYFIDKNDVLDDSDIKFSLETRDYVKVDDDHRESYIVKNDKVKLGYGYNSYNKKGYIVCSGDNVKKITTRSKITQPAYIFVV